MVDDGSDSWITNIDGTPFPRERLTWITPISHDCYPQILGCGVSSQYSSMDHDLAKTIAKDKLVSTFECSRKHDEQKIY